MSKQKEKTKFEIKKIDEITRETQFIVSADKLKPLFDARLKQISSTANLKGFRPGKAPLATIQKIYGEQIYAEIVSEKLREKIGELAESSEETIVSMPKVDMISSELGEDLEAKFTFSVFFEPEVKDYDKFEIEVEKEEVTKDKIEEVINNLLRNRAKFEKVEDRKKTITGDWVQGVVTISTKTGKGEKLQPEPFFMKLGEKKYPEKVETALTDAEVGTNVEIEDRLPANHQIKSIAGKNCVFNFSIEEIHEEKLPELNDKFVKELEQEKFQTVAELKKDVESNLKKELENQQKSLVLEKITDILIERNPFKLSEDLVMRESQRSAYMAFGDPKKNKLEDFDPMQSTQMFGARSEKMLRKWALLDSIAKKEKFETNDSDLEKEAEKISEQTGEDLDKVTSRITSNEQKESYLIKLTREKVLDFLESKTKVKFVAVKKTEAEDVQKTSKPKVKAKTKKQKAA